MLFLTIFIIPDNHKLETGKEVSRFFSNKTTLKDLPKIHREISVMKSFLTLGLQFLLKGLHRRYFLKFLEYLENKYFVEQL